MTVSNVSGTSPVATFNVNPLAPTITGLNPSTAVAGNTAYTLTISGTNFTAASTVQCNKATLAATYVSSTKMTRLFRPTFSPAPVRPA